MFLYNLICSWTYTDKFGGSYFFINAQHPHCGNMTNLGDSLPNEYI